MLLLEKTHSSSSLNFQNHELQKIVMFWIPCRKKKSCTVLILYPLKAPENERFFVMFMDYIIRKLGRNGLKSQ